MSQLRTQPEPAEVKGQHLKCLMCAHESFHKRKTHFDTALIGGLNPEWSDSEGHCLVCGRCGFIHWFMVSK
jgi:ribosomal protein L37E